MRSPFQVIREWNCTTRRYRMGIHIERGASVEARYLRRCEFAQYRPCLRCGCPRYYHLYRGDPRGQAYPPEYSDHNFDGGPKELYDPDRFRELVS